jgi:ribosome maturation factor RimP
MIDKEKITDLVNEKLDAGVFLVDVQVTASNIIRVFIDSFDGMTIDYCVQMSRYLERSLDRDAEDYELQVSSPGLSETFKVKEQYYKNIGRKVEVITESGEKIVGILKSAAPDDIMLEVSSLKKVEGQKKKQMAVEEYKMEYGDIKSAKVVVSFK